MLTTIENLGEYFPVTMFQREIRVVASNLVPSDNSAKRGKFILPLN